MIVETPDFDPKNNKTGYLLKSKMRLFKRAWKLIVKLLLPVNSVDGKDILIAIRFKLFPLGSVLSVLLLKPACQK